METCDFCGVTAELAQVRFRQNTGLILAREEKSFAGRACRDCARTYFWKATLHNLWAGWWGTISMFMTPIFIVGNVYNVLKTVRLTKPKRLTKAEAARLFAAGTPAKLPDWAEAALPQMMEALTKDKKPR